MKIMQHDLESCDLDPWPQGITSLAKRNTHIKFSWDHVRGLWDIENFSLWPWPRWTWPLTTMGTMLGPSLMHLPRLVEFGPRVSEIFKIFQYDLDLCDLDLLPMEWLLGPSLIHIPSLDEIGLRVLEILKIFQYDLDLWPLWEQCLGQA